MTKETRNRDIERLETVLEIYGDDPARWPDGERERLLLLVRTEAVASGLIAEAGRLRGVMAHAPGGSATPALERRIVAAALADRSREARVVPMETARRPVVARDEVGWAWPAAVLAASFAVGLYLGAADPVPRLLAGTFETAELDGAEAEDIFSEPVVLDGNREGGL